MKRFLLPSSGKWSLDTFSGITVALALIPESIAFALVAHLDPLIGLYSAFFLCLIAALIGGRPGMISGATGAMAVAVVALVTQFGVEYLFPTVILTGILQLLVGIVGLGKLIRILPKSVMVGFVNGLAIVIFIAQLEQFKVPTAGGMRWLNGNALYAMIALVALGMAITHFLPKLTKKLPAALTAIVVVTGIVHLFHLDVLVVNDMMGGKEVGATFPPFTWPTVPLSFATLKIILPFAITLCIIGLSESLMTLTLIDEMTHTKGRTNKECIGQGIANIVCGFFRGMGGCAMLGQSMINIKSGGRGRLSGIVAGVTLLLFILIFWPAIKMIPLAALVGVMFMVVIETFEWASFKFIRKIPLHDAFIIVIVTAVTVFTNLAIAVVTGVVIAALVFAWQTARHMRADTKIIETGAKEYTIHSHLYFGSIAQFQALFTIEEDPQEVILNLEHAPVTDHSALHALETLKKRYTALGKRLHLRHLNPRSKEFLR